MSKLQIGDTVKILFGAYEDFCGMVKEVKEGQYRVGLYWFKSEDLKKIHSTQERDLSVEDQLRDIVLKQRQCIENLSCNLEDAMAEAARANKTIDYSLKYARDVIAKIDIEFKKNNQKLK